jgi:periplasmic protein TonB
MLRRINATLLVVLSLFTSSVVASANVLTSANGGQRFSFVAAFLQGNDREQDGLLGPVRRVKTETAKITVKNGKPVEGPRVLLETANYDNKGATVDKAYFLAAGGSITGKEVYKYDDKGNIVEMTLTNDDGSLASKEMYQYEFDSVGNWTRMTTNVAVIEGGKLNFEATEVTYRTIAYYLDEAMVAKMSQPAPAAVPAATQPAPSLPTSTVAAAPKVTPLTNPAPAPPKVEPKAVASAPLNVAAEKPVGAAQPSMSMSSSPVGGPVVKNEGEAPAAPQPVKTVAKTETETPAVSAPPVSAPPVEPRPIRTGPLKPVSGGILNGKAVALPAPQYPEIAKRARATGLVEVEVVIDLTGKVISAKAVKGPALLQGAAEQAAKNARFSPTLLSGQPVRVSGVITYNFSLGN